MEMLSTIPSLLNRVGSNTLSKKAAYGNLLHGSLIPAGAVMNSIAEGDTDLGTILHGAAAGSISATTLDILTSALDKFRGIRKPLSLPGILAATGVVVADDLYNT